METHAKGAGVGRNRLQDRNAGGTPVRGEWEARSLRPPCGPKKVLLRFVGSPRAETACYEKLHKKLFRTSVP